MSQCDPVADGDVDTFVLVVALLVGNIGDEFLVDTAPDEGQVDGVHGGKSLRSSESSMQPRLQSIARPPLTGR